MDRKRILVCERYAFAVHPRNSVEPKQAALLPGIFWALLEIVEDTPLPVDRDRVVQKAACIFEVRASGQAYAMLAIGVEVQLPVDLVENGQGDVSFHQPRRRLP